MLNITAKIIFLILVPLSAFATPNGKEIITIQVVTSTTRMHGSFSNHGFSYTDLMFAQFNGKKVVYECVQRGDICPMMESGKTYSADRDGAFLHISMSLPDDSKALSVKYKQVGTW
jgi:hypothetical protein